ncbi:MAG: BNR-4 repeat-containing protein [Planctomycetota bacterium]
MKRRDFLKTLAAGTAGVAVLGTSSVASSAEPEREPPFLLSEHGCGRATGYAETNKIVTTGGKTHVAWIDSEGEGFFVRVRTLDRQSGAWSSTYTVGEAFDNHGGPALSVDSCGFLHLVYYPHHHPFRYRRSARPNDASEWDQEQQFGNRCTYPTLVCGPDDTLTLTCRESDRNPWVVNLYTKPPGGQWQGPTAILEALHPGYAHFQEALAWGPDHRTLHLSTRLYDGKPGRAHTVGYLRSPDLGKTWERSDGTRVELPATAKTVTVIADESQEASPGLRCGSIAVDPSGVPHVLFSSSSSLDPVGAWIASPDASGKWHRRAVLDELTGPLAGRRLTMAGGLTIASDGRMFVALQALKAPPGADTWGHASNEIVRLESPGAGRPFEARIVSSPNPDRAHWLPNIERPTGHNRVDAPSLIYTAGPPGEGCSDILSNGVYWVGPG